MYRRFLSAVRSAREALARGPPLANGLLKSLISLVVICCIVISSPPTASAKPFALRFPVGWSLADFARSYLEPQEPAGAKPYSGYRVSNDTLRMIYYCDQTVAIVELGPGKLLLNCELIETIDDEDTGRLIHQLSRINRPLAISFPQMIRLMSQCHQREGTEIEEPREAWADTGGANTGILGGNRLTLLMGIIPGTKWCGTGDIAATYHDLGADRPLDRCCRSHDLCPTKVRAFKQRYNLTNNSIYSKSHCTCDDMFFNCLKTTNTSAAHLMGHIYFNVVQVPCIESGPTGKKFRQAKQGF